MQKNSQSIDAISQLSPREVLNKIRNVAAQNHYHISYDELQEDKVFSLHLSQRASRSIVELYGELHVSPSEGNENITAIKGEVGYRVDGGIFLTFMVVAIIACCCQTLPEINRINEWLANWWAVFPILLGATAVALIIAFFLNYASQEKLYRDILAATEAREEKRKRY